MMMRTIGNDNDAAISRGLFFSGCPRRSQLYAARMSGAKNEKKSPIHVKPLGFQAD